VNVGHIVVAAAARERSRVIFIVVVWVGSSEDSVGPRRSISLFVMAGATRLYCTQIN
jgi:hypothetical protein